MSLSSWYEKFFATLYDPLLEKTERDTLSPLRSELLGKVEGLVLDLGAGTGSNLPMLEKQEGPRVFLDRSLPMLRKGIRKGMKRKGFPVVGSATALPFADDTFDSIVVTLVLCSVDDLRKSLGEIHRTLKPEGVLYVMEHVLSDSPAVARLQRIATPVWKIFAGGCHLDRATSREILSFFQNTEFRTEILSGLPLHLGLYKKIPSIPPQGSRTS